MQTVITRNIDGYSVIVGFDQPVVDPVVTERFIEPTAREAEETLELEEILKLPDADPREVREKWEKYYAMRSDLYEGNLCYCAPGPGEEIIYDDEAERLQNALDSVKPGQVLLRDGRVIPDNRGLRYWVKNGATWSTYIIEKLGIAPPENAVVELSEENKREIFEQIEREQIAAMTEEQREQSYQDQHEVITKHAVFVRSKLEIENDTQALVKAQEWYKEQKSKLEEKYGIASKSTVGINTGTIAAIRQ